MINNFDVIDKFLQFEDGYFYKFEALVRNTDGANPLYYEGCSNVNKNILIKNWYIDNQEYYNRIKKEMITLCNMTGARLYVTLDKKENRKLLNTILNAVVKMVSGCMYGNNPSLKTISKIMASCSSVNESSEHKSRTIMFDVDCKDKTILETLEEYILSKNLVPYELETKKGYHIFCYKKFNTSEWGEEILRNNNSPIYTDEERKILNTVITENTNWADGYKIHYEQEKIKVAKATWFYEQVSLKDNALGLVYMRGE